MKKIRILLLLVVTTVAAQKDYTEYKKDNFHIEYPSNWRLDTSGLMNSSFILYSELKENDLMCENINLIIQDLTNQGFTMESYTKLSVNQIKELVPEGKVIESKFNKKLNRHEIIWSGFIKGRKLKFKQFYILENEKVYLLTLTTLPETFEEYERVGDKVLNSFKLN